MVKEKKEKFNFIEWINSLRPKPVAEVLDYSIESRFTTSADKKLENATLARKVWDRVTSPTALRVIALGICIASIFTPLPYAIGVVSSVFSFASLAYGVYVDVGRVRETRRVQESLATLLEINELSSQISHAKSKNVGRYDALIKENQDSAIKPVKNKPHRVLEFIKKTPELGFCFLCTLATLDPVIAGLSASNWIMSMINESADNVSYQKNMKNVEKIRQSIIGKEGLDGFTQEELTHVLRGKRALVIAITAVEKELQVNPDINVEECFNIAHKEALVMQYEIGLKHETPSWLSDLRSVLFTKGTSAVESSKLFNPNYIPPEVRDLVAYSSNNINVIDDAADVRRHSFSKSYDMKYVLGAVGTAANHHELVQASTSIGSAISMPTGARVKVYDHVVENAMGAGAEVNEVTAGKERS